MECEACRENYVLFSEDYYRHGLRQTAQFWISKDTQSEHDRLTGEATAMREQVKRLRMERYGDAWSALFGEQEQESRMDDFLPKRARIPRALRAVSYKYTKDEGAQGVS